jgi:tRNA-splicing ligase RtcB (3'-phosphate/5'-hydroxy nucleic acid ligase)
MRQKNLDRLLRALAKQGLDVRVSGAAGCRTYGVRWRDRLDSPLAEILLPEGLPIEAKALKQLANLAAVSHPGGGCVCRVCATPDVHPGDSGVAIGSIVASEGLVVPAAVGSDINCGMRLHVADLSVDRFLAKRQDFVDRLKGDYFFGTRDVTMTARSARAMVSDGIVGWLDSMGDAPLGSVVRSDLAQLAREADRVFLSGSMAGHDRWAPPELRPGSGPGSGLVRDGGLGTIGGGNHFVEVQWVESIADRALAHAWGIREGQIAFMIHSGSRNVGKYIGGMWRDRAESHWAKGAATAGRPYPESRLFPLSATTDPEAVAEYLQAEATAANYGFVNRLLLAELLRLRLREVYGDLEAPLIYDLPHNITLAEDFEGAGQPSSGQTWISRKGACPAHSGQPVIIPGSMGAASYLLVGRGQAQFLNSASHGAGRLRSRFDLSRAGAKETEQSLGLTGVDCITLRDERRIEEAPAAYKPIDPVIDAQVAAGLVSIVAKLKPILTFKA